MTKTENLEREISVSCKKCGAQLYATIFYTHHKTGVVSATVCGMSEKCYYCAEKQIARASPSPSDYQSGKATAGEVQWSHRKKAKEASV